MPPGSDMLGTLARGLLKLLVAATLFLGTLEIYLAWWPDTLPVPLANHALSKYGAFPGGIYFHDPASGIHFMRRDFETEAYFNGYRWRHATDELGFRNPPGLEERSVLLLGDSLIYGHGVEEAETVAHILRAEHGVAAYDMARQGDCVYQSYVLLRLHLDELEPEAVVLFVFLNDFHDVTLYRDERQIETRPEASWDYEAMRRRLAVLEAERRLDPRLLLGLRSVRLLRGIVRDLPAIGLVRSAEAATRAAEGPSSGAGPEAADPPYLDTLLDPAAFTRVASYYEATLHDLAERLADAGIELHVVHLAIDADLGERWNGATERLAGFLDRTCRRLDLDCASTAGLFAECDECFLPGDGHLSPAGHRRLAAFTATMLSGSRGRPDELRPAADDGPADARAPYSAPPSTASSGNSRRTGSSLGSTPPAAR